MAGWVAFFMGLAILAWRLRLELLLAGILAALLAGCASIPVHAPTLEPGVNAAIDAGLHVKHGDEDAPLRVTARPGLKFGGHAYDTHGCTRQAYVRTGARPAIVAHELGHMMGLEHVDDPRNLMHPDAPTDHVGLTSEQRRTSKRARAVITACEAIQ